MCLVLIRGCTSKAKDETLPCLERQRHLDFRNVSTPRQQPRQGRWNSGRREFFLSLLCGFRFPIPQPTADAVGHLLPLLRGYPPARSKTDLRPPLGTAMKILWRRNVASAAISAINRLKVIIERHSDGYVAYPVGLNGAVVGFGDSVEEALADIESVIRFQLETFGKES